MTVSTAGSSNAYPTFALLRRLLVDEALAHWPRYALATLMMSVAAAATALGAYLIGTLTNEAYLSHNFRSIVVLGHTQCGGIRALMNGPDGDHGDFIESWMAIAHRARARVCDAPDASAQDFDTLCRRCEVETIRISLANLLTFPWIASRVAAGTLTLDGMHFNVLTGKLDRIT